MCNGVSVNDIYLSNHMLQIIHTAFGGPCHLNELLQSNEHEDKTQIAMQKIMLP